MSNVINSYRFGGAAPSFSFNNALTFDGVDDHVLFTALGAATTYTVSLWFKTNAFSSDRLIDGSNGTDQIRLQSSTLIQVRQTSTQNFTVPTMSTATWYHLMVAYQTLGTRAKVYLNSVESSSGGLNVGGSPAWKALGRIAGGGFTLDGTMDEVCIKTGYTGTLTDAQNLYNSGAGVDASTILTSPEIHFHLDESGTATTAVNSGSGSNGTLTNFPTSGMWNAH